MNRPVIPSAAGYTLQFPFDALRFLVHNALRGGAIFRAIHAVYDRFGGPEEMQVTAFDAFQADPERDIVVKEM